MRHTFKHDALALVKYLGKAPDLNPSHNPDLENVGSFNSGGFKEWFVQYVGKARGGDFKLQDMIQPVDATLSWVGAFLGIGITQILLMTMNKYVTWRGQVSLKNV